MADIIRLTEDWVNVTAAGTTDQPLYAAIDVLAYDVLDLMLVTAMETSGSPYNLTMSLLSGMQVQSTGSWLKVDAFDPVTSASTNTIQRRTLTGGFFRYLRWSVSLTNVTAARFMIEGVGRSNR